MVIEYVDWGKRDILCKICVDEVVICVVGGIEVILGQPLEGGK